MPSPVRRRSRDPKESRLLSGWEIRLVTLLSVIAGMVDLIGFMTLGNIFTAHITGNLVLISAAFLREVNPAQALAIPVFFVAVAVTWLIARVSGRHGRTLVRLLSSVQFLLLACVLVASVATGASARPQSLIAGTHCHDCRVRDGHSACASASRCAERAFDSRHDRQCDQRHPGAARCAVVGQGIEGNYGRAPIPKVPYSPCRISWRLRVGRGRCLLPGGLGLAPRPPRWPPLRSC